MQSPPPGERREFPVRGRYIAVAAVASVLALAIGVAAGAGGTLFAQSALTSLSYCEESFGPSAWKTSEPDSSSRYCQARDLAFSPIFAIEDATRAETRTALGTPDWSGPSMDSWPAGADDGGTEYSLHVVYRQGGRVASLVLLPTL